MSTLPASQLSRQLATSVARLRTSGASARWSRCAVGDAAGATKRNAAASDAGTNARCTRRIGVDATPSDERRPVYQQTDASAKPAHPEVGIASDA
jgi:hypothetical protein